MGHPGLILSNQKGWATRDNGTCCQTPVFHNRSRDSEQKKVVVFLRELNARRLAPHSHIGAIWMFSRKQRSADSPTQKEEEDPEDSERDDPAR